MKELSVDQCLTHLKKAKKDYKTAKTKHKDLRKAFLDSLPSKDSKHILAIENSQALGRTARYINGKLDSKSVKRIEHEGRVLTEKEEIEQVLLEVNKEKMHRSAHTSFMTEPLLSDFGYRGDPEIIEQVMDGTYLPPPGTDQYAQELLQEMKRPSPTRNPYHPRTIITTEDHIKAWRKAKEKTASGMSGLHFGMYQANCRCRSLAELDASQRSVAYSTGHCYKRWKKGLNVQLLKRSQDFWATKQRTILLMEADFNMNNKAMGADAMRAGKRLGALAWDNYGGCKGL